MKSKLKTIYASISNVIDRLDTANIEGPIPFLEDALSSIESAIDEIDMYHELESE